MNRTEQRSSMAACPVHFSIAPDRESHAAKEVYVDAGTQSKDSRPG
jgi:hypothetical protein